MDELSTAKTSRGIVSLRTVLRSRLLIGLYCNINSRTALRVLARLYCIFFACTCTILLLIILDRLQIENTWFMPLILEFNVYIFISILTGENQFFKFCKVIEHSDIKMGFDDMPLISSPIKTIFLLIFAMDIIPTWVSFYYGPPLSIILANTVFIMKLVANLNSVIYVMQLDMLRSRLGLLRHVFELNINRDNGNRIDINQQVYIVNNYLKLYKSMIDKFRETFLWAKPLILLKFALALIWFIIHGQIVIENIKTNVTLIDRKTFHSLMLCLMSSGIACLPAVFGELVVREVDKLKVAIGNKLLLCDDAKLHAELVLAGEYLEMRPSRITIYRVCALDASLILAYVGFSTSYLIVIIQTTGAI